MNCSSCGKIKAQVHPKKSRLATGQTLYMCQTCIDAKFEPRWVLILHARKNGLESIQSYIAGHKYVGRDILASEVV